MAVLMTVADIQQFIAYHTPTDTQLTHSQLSRGDAMMLVG
jgi:hypothetical protein